MLRIYSVDSSTGKPGEDLCDSIIEIKSSKKSYAEISNTIKF